MNLRRAIFILACILALTACDATATPRPPTRLTLIGDDTMAWLAQELGKAYTQRHPAVTFSIQSANPTTALSAANEYSFTIGLVARAIKPTELPRTRATPIALDGIAVIVNRANPINAIQRSQIAEIFSGQIATWPLGPSIGKPIVVVSREDGAGTRDAFDAMVMGTQRVTRAALVMPNETAMVDYIAKHVEAIGYGSLGALTPDVNALIIDDVPLTSQTVEAKKYPLVRVLSFIAPQTPDPEVQDFIAFALSAEGQKIVAQRYGRVQ
ncbi:MAG: phosphate ABC transporter substrate-binding protein [Chloroflexi bacterium]|nr:phosphate ABC transporter substrate-binding protein [Chloroflexota bacterium]